MRYFADRAYSKVWKILNLQITIHNYCKLSFNIYYYIGCLYCYVFHSCLNVVMQTNLVYPDFAIWKSLVLQSNEGDKSLTSKHASFFLTSIRPLYDVTDVTYTFYRRWNDVVYLLGKNTLYPTHKICFLIRKSTVRTYYNSNESSGKM